jgi:antitoxin HicB
MIRYQAKIYKDGKRYSVEFPDLPGCFSEGSSREEAFEHAREALSLHLEESRDPKWKVPIPKNRKGRQYTWVTPYVDVAMPLMIRQARQEHRLSQSRLAKRLKISVQQLQKLETPGKSNPTVKTLANLCRALNERLGITLAA